MGFALEIGVVLALTLLNAFFSGAEIAILSVRKTRLRELVDEGHGAARAAVRLRADPERFLATVQIGVTVLGIAAGAFGGARLEQPLAAWLRGLGLGTAAEWLAFGAVIAGLAIVSIVLGELVPKSLALRSGEGLALWVARPILALAWLARPLVWLLTGMSNVVLRPFRDTTTFTETPAVARRAPAARRGGVVGRLARSAGRHDRRARDRPRAVVDERGAVAGLLTVQEITEELVGEILAEHEAPSDAIHRESTVDASVAGTAPIHEINRELASPPRGRRVRHDRGPAHRSLRAHPERRRERRARGRRPGRDRRRVAASGAACQLHLPPKAAHQRAT